MEKIIRINLVKCGVLMRPNEDDAMEVSKN